MAGTPAGLLSARIIIASSLSLSAKQSCTFLSFVDEHNGTIPIRRRKRRRKMADFTLE
jgi:hypothetical protein